MTLVLATAGMSAQGAVPGSCVADGVALIGQDMALSYCELCNTGLVRIRITNPFGVDLTDLTVTQDLGASGLTYVPGTTVFVGTYVTAPPVVEPVVTGLNGRVVTWSLGGFTLPGPTHTTTRHTQLEIRFRVRRSSLLNEEGLVLADRRITATVQYSSECDADPQTANTGPTELPIRQPEPLVTKLGRNVDAAQGGYSDPVFAHADDDLIWRIQVTNQGAAPLQDLMVSDELDTTGGGNFTINYRCPTENSAFNVAQNNGVAPGGSPCTALGGVSQLIDFGVDDPYGNPAADEPTTYVDVPAGGTAAIFLVGKVTDSCSNHPNTAHDTEWGCEVDNPDGGIAVPASTGGAVPAYRTSDAADLDTLVANSGLDVARGFSGSNMGQPVGTKGRVTITITNNTGGTVKNIRLRDVLPAEYVVDPTFDPTIVVTPAYGAYAGMVDRVRWDNPAAGTYPLTTTNPALPLSNTSPEFTLYSSTIHPHYGDHRDMLRQGDQAVITFGIVMVRPQYFDLVADLDVRVEAPESDPPGTDPANNLQLSNRLEVDFEQFCNPGVTQHPPGSPFNDNFTPQPEDLDIDISDEGTGELIFILTNNDPLTLRVNVANHGGHDAADWTAFVSFGATMDVTPPAGCLLASNPPPLDLWHHPAAIPVTAHIYECTGGAIGPGGVRQFSFVVRKSTDPADLALDDLTFRADVVGEVTLTDGDLLWFPTPDTTELEIRANNYSLDAVRARVIGFNLLKSQVGNCTEEIPSATSPDSRVIIGEECTYHIDTGGWFGFQTPGFTYIAVQQIQVVDELPNGQGYLNSTDPYAESTGAILGVSLNPGALAPLDEGWIDWTFNSVIPAERITARDEWFRVNVTTRLLNDPIDARSPPNVHAATSTNTLNSTFQAVFTNASTGMEELYNLGPGTVGYPLADVRQVDLTVTEPLLTVTKHVCNETLYGTGTACSRFVSLADDGDAYNSYIYRVRVTNEASAGGIPRAPAYDVVSIDTLDASDLMRIIPFESDGLDNDGDGLADGADPDGEGSISDNVVNNGTPAQITFDHSHSAPLLRIAPGASVTFYYRVDPDDTVAPLQSLVNTVGMQYDSLAGAWGYQTAPQRPTSDAGGARLYHTTPASATVRIIPVLTQPKSVVRLSNTPLTAASPHPVVIGEEVEYQLNTLLPVARLRNFVIRDELPAGVRCIEAPEVDLDAPPYATAHFVPGGRITPTCTATAVEWDFGDQQVTQGTVDNRYDFAIRFIARVDNSAGNDDGDVIGNGGGATLVRARYVDELGATITLGYGPAEIELREPRIALSKSFAVANSDAGDEVTITIAATNTGTATAYNLQVFDDIAAVGNLIFLSGVGGLDPPDVVDTTTYGANRPLFRWTAANSRFAIAPGATVSFTFTVRVEQGAQPHEIFANTAHATWTSLPSRATALNTSGFIGADGSLTGLRNGAVPPAGDPVNDYESSAAAAMSVPPLALSKIDLAPATVPAPGAHKRFRIEIRLPEGTTGDVVATDELAQGDVSYVLADNAEFDVSYSFEGIATINGLPPGEAALLAVPADGATGAAVWNLGTVVTASEDDQTVNAVAPVIRIDYYARVNNDLVTDAGDRMENGVTLEYRNGESGVTESLHAAAPAVWVVEPALSVTKSLANATAGKGPGDAPDGGDLLEFTVTLWNSGGSTAHDINIVDTLSAELRLDGGFTPTAAIGGVAVAGFVAAPAGAPAGPLVWGRGNGDESLDLPAGQSLVLTYRARVSTTVEPGTVLDNSVLVDWTSLDGFSGYERDGAGCPDITAPNDYCTGPATTTTTVADANALVKSILADTYGEAPFSTADDAIVRVGDTITYELALQIQEGRTRQVRVQDLLPTGMTFLEIVSVNGDTTPDYTPPATGPGSNFSYAPLTAANRPAAGQTGALTWDLGTVTNDAAGDAATDTLVIVYRARVTRDAGILHVAETPLVNSAALDYVDVTGNPPPPAARLADDAVATLRQPIIDSLTKIDRSGRVSGDAVNVGVDVMNFRVTACNATGLAPAYDALLSDTLATQLDETSFAGPVRGAGAPDVYINGLLATPVTDYAYTAPAGRGGTWTLQLHRAVDPGACVQVDYDMGFHDDVGANQSWENSALLHEYWSLDDHDLGQRYGPVGPVHFGMNSVWPPMPSPTKSLDAPASRHATLGEEVVYHLQVPSTDATAALYDVTIIDTLDPRLRYVSAVDVSGIGLSIIDNSTPPGTVSLRIPMIPAGRRAIIELRARVDNNALANAGDTFHNTVSYTYTNETDGVPINGGSGTTGDPLVVTEPSLNVVKNVQNLTRPGAPDAGDRLRYTFTITAAGGAVDDSFSAAFDLGITEGLGLGLAYQGNPTVTGAGNTISAPVVTGDGVTTPQTLSWNLVGGNADVDVAEGETITFSYDVVALNGVRPNQVLGSATALQWTSLDGPSADERDGSASPAYNDYHLGAAADVTAAETTTLTKSRLADTYPPVGNDLRIGDLVEYELRLHLDEGTRVGGVVVDTLPRGLRFERTLNINGDSAAPWGAVAPFTHADIAAPAVTGDPRTGPTTVTWTVGDLVNNGDNDTGNDDFVIVYLARVVDQALVHQNDTLLTNSAGFSYTRATDAATQTGTLDAMVRQPRLVATKTAAPAGGDTIIEANELITYTVELTNTGTAPAYDPLLRDLLPVGLRRGAATVTTLSTTLAGVAVAGVTPAYDALTGIVEWDFDTGAAEAYTIPPGATLRVVYRVQADADLSAGLTLANAALAQRYYSFDDEAAPSLDGVAGVREIYGPGEIATVTLTTAAPHPLGKQNPAVTTAAVGEPFTYRITVPATPQATALHDVRILDDLTLSAADLSFVAVTRVSGSRPWTPVNTGTATQLVIEDTVNGIDIPAGEQVVIDVTVVLDDSPTNVSGLLFHNTASYTYDQVDGDPASVAPGGGDTTDDLIIVGADSLTLEKGGPATLRVGTAGVFTLDVHNTGTGRAWDLTLTDRLPNPTPGGMCDTPPDNVTAQIFEADGVTPVSAPLVEGGDFAVAFSGAPACTLSITMRSAAAAIGADQRLRVSYRAYLDGDNLNGAALTNVAGATQWFSADTAGSGATGAIRTYSRLLTDGSIATLDHEDAHTLTTETAVLLFQKSVINLTTGQDPGADATPGDMLRYRIEIRNNSAVAVDDFTLRDELDALNGSALFAPGTLALVTVPVGGDTTLTSATGGAHGTGLVDVAHLDLDAQGGANDSLVVEFDIRLAPVIAHGTAVLNQAQILSPALHSQASDDPNIDGADDPELPGDEDPTRTVIASAPAFRIEKISEDITGDPTVLMPGDLLRYTLTVKNVGTENATGVILRDPLPPNTTYVAGSTQLNGTAVADPAVGVSALQAGMVIHAPEDATPGALRADVTETADNVATITFDVRIDATVVNGTVISNQGFVTGAGTASGSFGERPSDDPETAVPDDPTRDVVGNVPLVDAQKTVAIVVDNGSVGIVDPGDVLRYTITITNTGGVPATGVRLTDADLATLAASHYVADTTFVNGLPAGQPDAGLSPLIAGIDVSSADQTPPLPSAGNGILSADGTATVVFDVQVDATAPAGTVISNQGRVSSNETPEEPTDADGIDSNGDQPTEVVVGSVQQLAITKEVAVVGGGAALPGGELEYTVRVTNIGSLPATQVVITDDLNPLAGPPPLAAYLAGSGTLDGSIVGISFVGGVLSGDYSTHYGTLPPGGVAVMRFRVAIDPGAAPGSTLTNTAQVAWSSPHRFAEASVSVDVGGTPGSAALSGLVWHDGNLDNAAQGSELRLADWSVDVYRGAMFLGSAVTDAAGSYRITGLAPGIHGLRFRAPGAGPGTAAQGLAHSAFDDYPQRIEGITAASGGNLLDLNLPLQPDGVIYNSVLRTAVAGAVVQLVRPLGNDPIRVECFEDPVQQGQVTTANGYYKFDIAFSAPGCDASAPGNYLIRVTPPAGFLGAGGPVESSIIPPASNAATPSFSVPACPGGVDDAVPATAERCEIQVSEFAPGLGVTAGGAGTRYYLHLGLDDGSIPRDSQAFNNHVPLDPIQEGAVAITKTAALVNATRGQIVPYTITLRNTWAATLRDLVIVDTVPPGFKYVEGSARLDGVKVEPTREGRQLRWASPILETDVQHELDLLLVIGSGVSEGEYVNRAQLFSLITGGVSSAEAQATVRVVPDPTFDCTDIIGKVFDDGNVNGIQDEGEPGLAGVRIISARGLIMTTDAHGRYHITCAAVPNEERGSNFILKLDDRSLPTGYRVTTENPLVLRATRGKMMKFNFGAAIHRVVSLGLQEGVFEPGSTELRLQWQPRVAAVITELRKSASVLRLSYMADVEEPALVAERVAAIKGLVTAQWRELECCRELAIETEIFWRRGAPPETGGDQ